MTRFAILPCLAALCLLGCGKPADEKPTPVVNEGNQGQASSAVIGVATDAGLNQLYAASGNALAFLVPTHDGQALYDGPSPLGQLVRDLGDQAPQPAPGFAIIDRTVYANPVVTAGSISYSANSTGLNTGWHKVVMQFGTTATLTPFTITTENGDTAALTSGQLDLYVHDVYTNLGGGHWTRQVDVYALIPIATPLVVEFIQADKAQRIVTVSGLRHARQSIDRTLANTTVTRQHVFTVDGDCSGLADSGAGLSITNGPLLPDHQGYSRLSTQWSFVSTAGTVVWNRFATFGIQYQYVYDPANPPVWTGTLMASPVPSENIYITLPSGTRFGPYNWAELRASAAMAKGIDLNATGQHL